PCGTVGAGNESKAEAGAPAVSDRTPAFAGSRDLQTRCKPLHLLEESERIHSKRKGTTLWVWRTRKGAPTNRAGTPWSRYVEGLQAFAKSLQRVWAKKLPLGGEPAPGLLEPGQGRVPRSVGLVPWPSAVRSTDRDSCGNDSPSRPRSCKPEPGW